MEVLLHYYVLRKWVTAMAPLSPEAWGFFLGLSLGTPHTGFWEAASFCGSSVRQSGDVGLVLDLSLTQCVIVGKTLPLSGP